MRIVFDKLLGSKLHLLDPPKSRVKKSQDISLWANFAVCLFLPFFAHFGPFLGRYQVCCIDVRLPSAFRVNLQYILSVSLFFWPFFDNLWPFLSCYHYFLSFFAISSFILGIFFLIQDVFLPEAPIGDFNYILSIFLQFKLFFRLYSSIIFNKQSYWMFQKD